MMKKAIVLIFVAAMLVMSCGCEKVSPKVATGSVIDEMENDDKEKDEEKGGVDRYQGYAKPFPESEEWIFEQKNN